MATVTFPSTPDCEIVSTRIVNFSQELVFEAWTNPDHLKKWWGPKELQIPLKNLTLGLAADGNL